MIVYGEILVAENFITGAALLWITAQIHRMAPSGWRAVARILAGGFLCGIFSLVIFLPVKAPMLLMMEAVFAPAVCFIVFGRRRVWQKALTFLLVTYFVGGFTMALLLATGNTGLYAAAGVYTGDLKAGILALFLASGVMTAGKLITVVKEKKLCMEHILSVTIVVGGIREEAVGFLDTGNGLKEPVSGRPAAVVGKALWSRLEQRGMVKEERFCIVPYETVGGSGIMMGIRTDYIESDGRRMRGYVIANGGETSGKQADFHMRIPENCDLLLSRDMTDMKW